jgi:N-acetylmuramoyl-L-alanine amidase
MAKHSVQRKRKKKGNSFSFGRAVVLVLCFIGVSFGLYLWQAAFSIGQPTPTVDDDDFRPTIGEPPYRIVIDAGHGGSDPGARGVVQESEMTAATAEALSAWLERDPNYIPDHPGKLRQHRKTR